MCNGRVILHLIDLCTQLSAATIIPNKNKEPVVKHIFPNWIAVYGPPRKIFAVNESKFSYN